jgi:hypothetical protein
MHDVGCVAFGKMHAVKYSVTKSDKRFLLLLLLFWFVWSEAGNIADFFAGFYEGAGTTTSRAQ